MQFGLRPHGNRRIDEAFANSTFSSPGRSATIPSSGTGSPRKACSWRMSSAHGPEHLHMRSAWQTLLTLEEHAEFYGVQPRQEAGDGVVRLRWPLTLSAGVRARRLLRAAYRRHRGRAAVPRAAVRARRAIHSPSSEATALLRLGEHTEVESHGRAR